MCNCENNNYVTREEFDEFRTVLIDRINKALQNYAQDNENVIDGLVEQVNAELKRMEKVINAKNTPKY